MNENIIKILKIASKLDDAGLKSQASSLDRCAENLNLIKQAQYDGVQGYWVRNSRCWQNCYRQKRSSSPDKPLQEIWNDCHSEFVGSLYGNKNSDWGKYADDSLSDTKVASVDQRRLIDTQFDKVMDDILSSGMDVEAAVAEAIIKQCSSYTDLMSEVSMDLLKVAGDIKDHSISDAISLVDVGDSLTKEAQGFFRKLLDTLKGGVSYGKDAISDSRVRGTLERLSDKAVHHLQYFYDSMKNFNNTIKETLDIAQRAASSGSGRLQKAGEETVGLLGDVNLEYDVGPILARIRKLPYSKKTIPNEDVGFTEDHAHGDDSDVGMRDSSSIEAPSADSEFVDEKDSPSASSGDPGEFISENMDMAKDVASKIIQDMNQTEQGQEKMRQLISGLGVRLSGVYNSSFNLSKESQFRDQSEMLDRERSMDILRAKREAIKARPGKEDNMKKDMMVGLARRNPYRFLTDIMDVLGKGQFVLFLNEIIESGGTRGSGGKFRKKIKGTFEDMGGSLDL